MTPYKYFNKNKYESSNCNKTNTYNSHFNTTINSRGMRESDSFTRNISKYSDFISWGRFNPDLFYDLITPETGGIRLDLDQRVFLRCIARFVSTYSVFPRGYGKCVAGDTLIITDNGIKEIGELFSYQNNMIETIKNFNINVINRNGKLANSVNGVYSGYLPTKIISTKEGYKIEGTFNHPILVLGENGENQWKLLKDIKLKDYVVISRNNNVWGSKTKLEFNLNNFLNNRSKQSKSHLNLDDIKFNDVLDEEFALIIGYLLGDGCLTQDNSVIFSNIDKDILDNLSKYLQKIGLGLKKCSGNECDYYIHSVLYREYLCQLGLKKVNAFGKEIPKIILEAPKNIVSKCLQGLFDTGGGISHNNIEFCTASEKMVRQIQTILINFGIISKISKIINKKYNNQHYRLFITGENVELFLKEIGFSCSRKQQKLVKISKVKRNTNVNVIPYMSEIINEFYQDVKSNNPYLYDKIYNIIKGNNNLSYNKLKQLLTLNNVLESRHFNLLKSIDDNHYFYSQVTEIHNNYNHVYDLSVPETNSFVSNGFVSHNTLLEVMAMYHAALFYPDIEIAMSAQTKENAASLLEAKHKELIRFYPLLKNEIVKTSFTKMNAEVIFTSGATIDTLANHPNSLGQRRKRLNIEESAMLNNYLFQQVLEPIPNIPRRTIGKEAVVNPEELNGQINFFTTSGYRGSDEYVRSLLMLDEMAELKGKIVIGASWELACEYGRGETKSKILAKKAKNSPIHFAQNYESKWVNIQPHMVVTLYEKLSEPVNAGCDILIILLSVKI